MATDDALRFKIADALRDGPCLAEDVWRKISASDDIWRHYEVAVQMLPMIRQGIIRTDALVSPEQDRVVTADERLSLVGDDAEGR